MNEKNISVFEEYRKGCEFKTCIGNKGLYEQAKINERFYIGDQWHGAKCGNERPLVRHNIIKRIGDYKMSQILSNPISVKYSADGIPTVEGNLEQAKDYFNQNITDGEINYIMRSFGNYFDVISEKVKMQEIKEKVLRNAYISGTSVLYTYWDSSVSTGLFADTSKKVALKGDIRCEVLDIEDIVFGDPYVEDIQNQPYIIISSRRDTDSVLREARLAGANLATLDRIAEEGKDGKITLLTKLFKEYIPKIGYTIKGIKVTERAIVKDEFDTGLTLYPLAIFCWERKNNLIYGESEITFLIPNQIAINRMITANVWSSMTSGMPIMVVNGDTVTDKITNDPGQIIKVFGSNEDVAGAVKYISPPSLSGEFDASINTLIDNTLTQSGANQVALGDSKADNATALATMRDAALMPLQIIKNRFYTFIEDTARIWADFWIAYYGRRCLKLSDKGGCYYIPFDGNRYKNLVLCTKVDINNSTAYSERERTEMLLTLFEKGIIDRKQLLTRLPSGTVSDIEGLIESDVMEEE